MKLQKVYILVNYIISWIAQIRYSEKLTFIQNDYPVARDELTDFFHYAIVVLEQVLVQYTKK